MQWEEVRKIYPGQYVKLQILTSHTKGNTKFVDEVALICAIQDPKEATKELHQSGDGVIVSHTAKDELKVKIRTLRGLRGAVQHGKRQVIRMSVSKEENEQPTFTDEQKKKMHSVIFNDAGVRLQLHQAQKDRKDGISTYCDSEKKFAQLLKEIGNDIH